MKWKYAIKEFRRELLLNLIVILQAAVIFLTVIAAVTSVVSRYQYYAPFADLLHSAGNVLVLNESMSDEPGFLNAQGIADTLKGGAKGYGIYTLAGAVPQNGSVIVYDDALWEAFHPQLLEGKAVLSDNSDAAQVLVSKGSGYKTGKQIPCQYVFSDVPIEHKMEVSGVFDDKSQILYYNANAIQNRDFRMLFMTFGEVQEEYNRMMNSEGYPIFYLMSAHEAQKLCNEGDFVVNGLMLLSYTEEIDTETANENMIQLSRFGMIQAFDNAVIRQNSMDYIYEQLYMLLPVLIGTSILLLVSILSVNAVSVTKQLRTYAVYRCCGLSWYACCILTAEKALMNTLLSLLLCAAFLLVKPHIPALDGLLIRLGAWQLIFIACIVCINVAISFLISTTMLRTCTPNSLLRTK